MSEPSEAAYEAARAKYDGVVISHGAFGYRAGHYDAIRAAVDAVWPLALAEGRRQAAAEIRAQADDVPYIQLRNGSRLKADSAVAWAARIAEGTTTA
jgi:hypothetical protein